MNIAKESFTQFALTFGYLLLFMVREVPQLLACNAQSMHIAHNSVCHPA